MNVYFNIFMVVIKVVWFGHLQRMDEERLPQEILNWTPTGRRKRENKNKMERRRTQSYGKMWYTRWRLGGDFVGDWVLIDVARRHKTTATIKVLKFNL
jgi:hypothetical protein